MGKPKAHTPMISPMLMLAVLVAIGNTTRAVPHPLRASQTHSEAAVLARDQPPIRSLHRSRGWLAAGLDTLGCNWLHIKCQKLNSI